MLANRKLKYWLLIGASEIILALALIAMAPTWLNSKKPWIGFAIWLTAPMMLTTSSIYAVTKLTAANKSRTIFVTAFPEYSHLAARDFLELPPAYVSSQIDLLKAVKNTESITELNISLFEILEQTKDEQT